MALGAKAKHSLHHDMPHEEDLLLRGNSRLEGPWDSGGAIDSHKSRAGSSCKESCVSVCVSASDIVKRAGWLVVPSQHTHNTYFDSVDDMSTIILQVVLLHFVPPLDYTVYTTKWYRMNNPDQLNPPIVGI